MTAITIQVSDEVAEAYAGTTPAHRKKVALLLRLRLQELVTTPPRPLSEILDEVGAQAERLGLTDDELTALLHDD